MVMSIKCVLVSPIIVVIAVQVICAVFLHSINDISRLKLRKVGHNMDQAPHHSQMNTPECIFTSTMEPNATQIKGFDDGFVLSQ
jgi:hypothetical protein